MVHWIAFVGETLVDGVTHPRSAAFVARYMDHQICIPVAVQTASHGLLEPLRWNLTMLLISLMDVDEIALSPIGLLA